MACRQATSLHTRRPFILDAGCPAPPATYPDGGPRHRLRLCRLRVQSSVPSLFGLAPGGVCRAAGVAAGAVRSYRTVSPLPRRYATCRGGLFSVALSLGSRPPDVIRHRLSIEPGLSSPAKSPSLTLPRLPEREGWGPERPSDRLTGTGMGRRNAAVKRPAGRYRGRARQRFALARAG
jgi:hypothetical protein